MATRESERVQAQRKENFDRVPVLIEKGGKHLINVLAIREGVKKAEVIRRAILARAGLRKLPYPDALEGLAAVNTQEEANAAILRLQAHEESSEIIKHLLEELAPEPDAAMYNMEVSYDLQRVAKMLLDAEPDSKVVLSGYEIGILRRALANIQHIVATQP